ncbi:helix-turn-helix domain-containing protein [Bacillus pseudomycoides]|nr:hypothetical protein bpmyx0001_45360 [Bacillus pseudomycoides DSM 12442]PDY14817.1 helix-turn-helix domain-containing protein [Bacillus pseudomycoides]PEU39609.1 helix-turn-helix domain-containing protein [Bacillus pseudomycoides]PFY21568.1 helix-turn-helix domain-containing protein [Bacillus pseudomycoides]PGA69667.1 helix-turn-helix domain-containing protein [Bacillus pseudomycoides]
MEGKADKKADEICNIHHQSVSKYVKRFNEGGPDLFIRS